MLAQSFYDRVTAAVSTFIEALFGDRTWPDAAFVVEKGAEKDSSGKTLQKFRHLPHHNKNVTDPNDDKSVDLPHLRNALARVNQVQPVSEDAAGFRKRAQAHLVKHAKALLKTHEEKQRMPKKKPGCGV